MSSMRTKGSHASINKLGAIMKSCHQSLIGTLLVLSLVIISIVTEVMSLNKRNGYQGFSSNNSKGRKENMNYYKIYK